jgi:3D (Asp-Asp-Asp) domain-containing protein
VRRSLALTGAAALCAALAATGAASPVTELRERQATLATRQTAVELELYALTSASAAASERLQRLRALREQTETQLERLRIELDVAWRSLYSAQELLGARIRQLYQHGQLDPVAVLLGSESLDEAVDGLEGLRNLALGDRDLLGQVTRARDQLRRAKARARARAESLRAAEAVAAATAARLRQVAAERNGYVARLRRERGYTRSAIGRLEAAAEAARRQSAAITAPAPAPTVAEAAPARELAEPFAAGAELTVLATAYSIRGHTSTGLATGWGVVAVDPAVIPLGTRLTIPGYGEGVAADTGSAVRGNAIDLWFPTRRQALAWGRQTVTIRLGG